MGFFSKLYKSLTGRGKATPAAQPSKLERIRQTAADEYQTRTAAKADAGTSGGLAAIKAQIAAESAKILADLGKPFAAEAERQRAEHLRNIAETDRRIEASKPENRFLAGGWKLTLNIDFRSTNPDKPAVWQVWYAPLEESIYVTFYENGAPGRTYRYWTITKPEALQMFRASSKGIQVWDQMRVRGSKTAHKKSYAQV